MQRIVAKITPSLGKLKKLRYYIYKKREKMNEKIDLETSWLNELKNEFKQPYIKELKDFLLNEQKVKTILPKKELYFNALNSTPLSKIKVVILGQDPYPNKTHPHGLAFSVLPEVKPLPPSLKNINKELLSDLNIDNSHTGYLQPWADQGVLLLNAILSVEEGKSNSHKNRGWEKLTDKIIEIIDQKCENIVFILWGGYAQKKGKSINEKKHLIIKTPHPSPLSAYRGFFGSKLFSKTNDYLKKHNKKTINWQLS